MTPQLAVQFFLQRGYSPEQAAAIVGRLMVESGQGLDPNASGDNGTAYGLAQWRGDRQAGLKDWAAQNRLNYKDPSTQLGYVDWELKNRESTANTAMQNAGDIPGAVGAMMHYERPQGYDPNNPQAGMGYSQTLAYARGLLGSVPGQDPGQGQAAPGMVQVASNAPNTGDTSANTEANKSAQAVDELGKAGQDYFQQAQTAQAQKRQAILEQMRAIASRPMIQNQPQYQPVNGLLGGFYG